VVSVDVEVLVLVVEAIALGGGQILAISSCDHLMILALLRINDCKLGLTLISVEQVGEDWNDSPLFLAIIETCVVVNRSLDVDHGVLSFVEISNAYRVVAPLTWVSEQSFIPIFAGAYVDLRAHVVWPVLTDGRRFSVELPLDV